MPIVEDARIIVCAIEWFCGSFVRVFFTEPPAVEGLVHDEHAHAIAEFEQLRCGRVVAGANGIAAHFLENLDLPLECAYVDRGAERSLVVVETHALKKNVLTVEQQTAIWIDDDRTNTEGCFDDVDGFSLLVDGGDGEIALSVCEIPQFRMWNFEGKRTHAVEIFGRVDFDISMLRTRYGL